MSDRRMRELARRAAAGDLEAQARLRHARIRARVFESEAAAAVAACLDVCAEDAPPDAGFEALREGVERGGWQKATRIRVALAVLRPSIDAHRSVHVMKVVRAVEDWLARPSAHARRSAGRAASDALERRQSSWDRPDRHVVSLGHATASQSDDTVTRACVDAFDWATHYPVVRSELLDWALGIRDRLRERVQARR